VGNTTTGRSINFQQPASSQTVLIQQNGNNLIEYNNSNLTVQFDQAIRPIYGASLGWLNGQNITMGSGAGNNPALQLNVNSGGGSYTSEQYLLDVPLGTTTISGGYATERLIRVDQPTITAASALTLSTEGTALAIAGPPIAGGSATITKSIGLHIQAGSSVGAGATTAVGLQVDAPSGGGTNLAASFGTGPTSIAADGSVTVGGANLTMNTTGSLHLNSNGMDFGSFTFRFLQGLDSNDAHVMSFNPAGTTTGAEDRYFGVAATTHTINAGYANQRFNFLDQNTVTAASALNISTEATNLYVNGPPKLAGSATASKVIGLHVGAGATVTSAATVGVGLKVDAPTGAGANKAAEISGHVEYTGTAPTLSSCGTSPSIVGNDMVGRVTVGTSPSTTCTLTFNAAFTNAPICFAQDETTSVTMRATTISTTAVTFTASASMTASDKLSYRCEGYF